MGIVQRFAAAFNRADVDGLLACFTEEATYRDAFFGAHAGQKELRAMFERMFHEGRDYRWTMERVVEDARTATAEWTFAYVVSDAIPRSAGRAVRFAGMSIFELQAGTIAAYREHFNVGAALLQIGFEPEGLAKVLRRQP